MAYDNDELSLKEIIAKVAEWYNYLLFKWYILLTAVIIGGALGFLYADFKKPVYTAASTFVLEESGGGGGALGQYAGVASLMGIDLGGTSDGIFQGDNIIELYKSRKMIEKTLLSEVDIDGKKQLLVDRYLSFNKLREKWANEGKLSNLRFDKNEQSLSRIQDSILGKVVKDIKTNYLNVSKPDKKLSIIKVEVKAKDEAFAKLFNDDIVANVNEFYVQTKTKKSLDNISILEQKTDSVRAVMNGAIYTAVRVSDATPNLNPTRQVQKAAPMQRAQFSMETNKAILTELVKNLEMSKMSLMQEKPLIQVIDAPVYPLDKDQVGRIRGTVLGGALFGVLVCIFLITRRIYSQIISE